MGTLYIPRIRVTADGADVRVSAPYNPHWPPLARSLGGQWNTRIRVWHFDLRDLGRVRDALIKVYGWDGTYPVEILDARLLLDGFDLGRTNAFWMFGRLIVERLFRDAPARLGPGVILVRGGFPASGGSRKHPSIDPDPGTELEVRDVFAAIFAARKERWPQNITEVPGSRRIIPGPGGEAVHTGAPRATGQPRRRIILEEKLEGRS